MSERAASLPGAEGASLLRRLAFALLLALPLLWNLGGNPLFDVDEGAFSEATREILASGDWGHTTLNGAPRFDKPIGVYWLQAASVALFGLNEFALRLPSALSCWLMALALAAFAARRWGQPAGLLAGLLTVTSVGVQAIGRGATADALLNLLLVLAGLDLWRFIESQERAPLRRAYAWVGLGLLVKGPVAVLVPGAAFFLWVAFNRRWTLLRLALLDLPGWVLLLGLSVPWYVYALHRHGMAFIDGFLLRHNVDRFTGTIGGHAGTPLYYLAVLPLLAMPWAPLLALVVARFRTLWRDPVARYLLGWSVFVIAFFSLSGTKLPHYVLYGYGPLALLMARTLAQGSRRLLRVAGFGVLAWAAIVVALPWIALRLAPSVRDPLYHALLAGAQAPDWLPGAAVLLLVAGIVLWPRGDYDWRRPAAAAAALALFIGSFTVPWFGETLQGPVGRAAAVAAGRSEAVVMGDVRLPSFAVYLRRVVPGREAQPGELIFTRVDRIHPQDAGRPRLFEERGIVLLGPRPAP